MKAVLSMLMSVVFAVPFSSSTYAVEQRKMNKPTMKETITARDSVQQILRDGGKATWATPFTRVSINMETGETDHVATATAHRCASQPSRFVPPLSFAVGLYDIVKESSLHGQRGVNNGRSK